MPNINKEYKIVNIVFTFFLIFLLFIPLAINSINSLSQAIPDCFVKTQAGQPCSSCGLTRSILALYHGDYALSQYWHPAGIIFIFIIVMQLCLRLILKISKSIWVPWIDIAQILIVSLIFKFVIGSR